MKNRHLNGKGEISYDYKNDILLFKVKDRDYKKSIEFENFIIDIDAENFVTGVRIFDVSKVASLDKILLKNLVQAKFEASIQDNLVTIRLNFVGKMRNRIMPIFSKEENFTQQIITHINESHRIQNSTVNVPQFVVA